MTDERISNLNGYFRISKIAKLPKSDYFTIKIKMIQFELRLLCLKNLKLISNSSGNQEILKLFSLFKIKMEI